MPPYWADGTCAGLQICRAGSDGIGKNGTRNRKTSGRVERHGLLNGGTTIEAVKVLEEKGFRAAVIDAIQACMAKSEQMSK